MTTFIKYALMILPIAVGVALMALGTFAGIFIEIDQSTKDQIIVGTSITITISFITIILNFLIEKEEHKKHLSKELSTKHSIQYIEYLFKNEYHGENKLARAMFDLYKDDVINIVDNKRLQISSKIEFVNFYVHALKNAPYKSSILASASPDHTYIWGEEAIIKANEDFIKNEGKIYRTFILNSQSDVFNENVSGILQKHANIGVHVYWVTYDQVKSKALNIEYYIVDKDKTFGWEVFTENNAENKPVIKGAEANWGKKELDGYSDWFSNLDKVAKGNLAIKHFTKVA